ncbi:MAG: amino acid permease [Acidobacteriota bacterium]
MGKKIENNYNQVEFVKGLGVVDATNIVIGSMIGSGIFIAPSLMAGYIQTPGILIFLWLIGGILTVFGALSYGELASSFPRAGGQYVFLKEAYSPIWGFLYGWTLFLVIQSGFIAAVAIAFSKFLGVFLPFIGEEKAIFTLSLFGQNFIFSSAQLASIICIGILTYLNILGVKSGALIQNVFTFSKVGAILLLILSAFLIGKGSFQNFIPLVKPVLPGSISMGLFAALAVAMSKALFAYDAWYTVTFVAEEVRNPHKNIPLSMFFGTGAVTLIYTLTTMAYLFIIPIDKMAIVPENRIGASVAESILAQPGLVFITIAILISTFGCVNGLILAGPRLYYAMARDGLFFKKASFLHREYKTPHVSLIYQGIWSSILSISGTYNDLLTYTAFASLLFNSMTVGGLIILRYRRPDLQRPYKVLFYPFLPLIYIAIALFFIVYIIIGDPLNSIKGLLLIGIGIPAYLYWRTRGIKNLKGNYRQI